MTADGMVLDASKVRAWCRSRGVPVAPGGVLPAEVLARYVNDTVTVTCSRHWVDRKVHADMPDSGCPRCSTSGRRG